MTEIGEPRVSDQSPARTAWQLHALCYLLLGGILIYVMVDGYMRPLVFDENIGADSARVELIEQRIDPNTAHWSELARLPRIGKALAKRIIAYRREQLSLSEPNSGNSTVVFRSLEDLKPIKGIGPKTLARIEPLLKFPTRDPPVDR